MLNPIDFISKREWFAVFVATTIILGLIGLVFLSDILAIFFLIILFLAWLWSGYNAFFNKAIADRENDIQQINDMLGALLKKPEQEEEKKP